MCTNLWTVIICIHALDTTVHKYFNGRFWTFSRLVWKKLCHLIIIIHGSLLVSGTEWNAIFICNMIHVYVRTRTLLGILHSFQQWTVHCCWVRRRVILHVGQGDHKHWAYFARGWFNCKLSSATPYSLPTGNQRYWPCCKTVESKARG